MGRFDLFLIGEMFVCEKKTLHKPRVTPWFALHGRLPGVGLPILGNFAVSGEDRRFSGEGQKPRL